MKGVNNMKKFLLTLATLSLVLFLAACGGGEEDTSSDDGSEPTSGDSSTVDITATNWEFDQEEYTAPAGEVTVKLTSEEGFHGIQVEGTDIEIEQDGTASGNLEPGEYTIICSVPCGAGHDDMVSTLIVE